MQKGCDIIDKYFPESELYNVPLDTQEQAMIHEAVELAKSFGYRYSCTGWK